MKESALKGRKRPPFSEEWKKRMSESQKGNKNHLGHKHSVETRNKMSEKLKGRSTWNKKGMKRPEFSGEKHPRWVVDRAELKVDRLKSYDTQYKYWMIGVKNRDGWKCRISNKDCGGRLEAHHILDWTNYPHLRYDTNNGITLCVAHHPRKRSDEKELSPFFQKLVTNKN